MNNPYQSLLATFLKIGLFGFGGGYAMLPLISDEVVALNNWMTSAEFADMVAISQMTPGPIAINTATYVGFVIAGISGSALATFAVCFLPFLMMYTACRFFMRLRHNPRMAAVMRLLRPAVVGLVLAATLLLMNRENFVDWKSGVLFAAAFVLTAWMNIHPILVLVGAGVFGWLAY